MKTTFMKRALVTGATGHIGRTLCRALGAQGVEVVALVRPGYQGAPLVDVTVATGDVLDGESLIAAAHQCDVVFHCAAVFEIHTREPDVLHRTSVEGTRATVLAARRAGAKRVVLTSSVAATGFGDGPEALLDESNWANDLSVPYYRAKQEAERVAMQIAAEEGVELVTVLPTLVLGPDDHRVTPSSRFLVDMLRGAGVTIDGGLNVIDVRDLASAMIEAARKGRAGARYILGGENMLVRDFGALVTRVTGRPVKHVALPRWAMTAAAAAMELSAAMTGGTPALTRDAVRDVYGKYAWYDVTRARTELGLTTRPTLDTLRDAAAFFRATKALPSSTAILEAA
ncbi:MAG: NAD-dependent epimerase/dehydratase family protein [Labilithrix sp.]|nr:NAD-dependent epimerase/dehydratase family protein [Labilithrix sp.]